VSLRCVYKAIDFSLVPLPSAFVKKRLTKTRKVGDKVFLEKRPKIPFVGLTKCLVGYIMVKAIIEYDIYNIRLVLNGVH